MKMAPNARDHLALVNEILAPNHSILDGKPRQETTRMLQTQGLLNTGIKIGQLGQHVERNHLIPNNLINLLLSLPQHFLIAAQKIVNKRKRRTRRLVPSPKERGDLILDILNIKLLPRLAIHPIQHDIQQIPRIRPRILDALPNNILTKHLHLRDVLLALLLLAVVKAVQELGTIGAARRFYGCLFELRHEGVRGLGVEFVEAVAEGAEADGVEGEPGCVFDAFYFVCGAEAVPF